MKQLENAFEQLNITTRAETVSKFERYMKLVLAWNEKVNLTAIKDENDFIKKHFIDSILCAGFSELINAETVIDVGTGAGFPGVPLALIFPQKQFLLIDSTGKKIKILGEITAALEIPNVTLIHARAEELSRKEEYREKFDLCVSRAVANLAVLSEYCLPFVSAGGSFISYKGPDTDKEVKEAKRKIKALGGDIADIRKVELLGFDLDHSFIIVKKNRNVSRETFK